MTPSEQSTPEGLATVTDQSLRLPKHLVLSAWTEHAPFAFWLVEAHRPRTIVELGTHNGFSYFALCQAVADQKLATRCFAVDTWQGDEHAGFYSDEVYGLVSQVNANNYAAFSTLVRSTFDAAVGNFADASIDLLHIDGRHFYEDVAHDFATWLPKLSSRAVVLLHDTNVHERSFGVHQLWNEVRDDFHGSVEFLHGHGLGVLQVGADVDADLARWFERHREPSAVAILRASYERLGRGVLDRIDVDRGAKRNQDLERKLADTNAAIDRRNESLRNLESRHLRTRAELEKAEAEIQRLRQELQQRQKDAQAEAQRLRQELQQRQKDAEATQQLLATRADEIARLRKHLQRLRSRRLVRLALAVADRFRPAFRLVRRRRRPLPTKHVGRSEKRCASDQAGRSAPEAGAPLTEAAAIATNDMVVDSTRDGAALLANLERVDMPTVLVPIFNAPRELSRCLASIERNTTVGVSLLLIDDASTDPLITEVLKPWRNRANVRVLRHSVNRGFTATVNHGIDEIDGDIIVLNSDTEVPPAWIQGLRRAAYMDASIGSVTPLSDNSGAFAVPDVGARNPIPIHLGPDGLGRLISRSSLHALPETPTGNGFCWYVKRPVFDSIGKLDDQAFPRGYGEENDFCMRATRSGWRHVVDDATYVAHTREASFGSEKSELVAAGRRVINERYPEYTDLVHAFVHGESMDSVRSQVRTLLTFPPAVVKPRILYIAQIGQGGTPATTRDLASALNEWESLVFESDGREVRLLSINGNSERVLERFSLSHPVEFAARSHEEYDAALAGVIRRYGIELVHVRHLIKQPLSAPRVASAQGVPVVLSFHDYYFSCPTVHLLDDKDRFCAGVCTPGMGSCRVPTPWIGDVVPQLKHAWVHTWREIASEALKYVDAFVTTSDFARKVMTASLPELEERRFDVIEHGRDIHQDSLAQAPAPSGPVRVLIPGNLDMHKGEALLRQIRSLDAEGRLEFHFIGTTSEDADTIGVNHGPYTRDELADIVSEVRPSFVAILSPWGETYCHTLTEAWSMGLPVIACDEGALGERVRTHGGGLLVDPHDAVEAYREMCRLSDDAGLHASLTREAESYEPRPVSDMALDYEELYLDVHHARRAFVVERTRLRVGLLVPGRSDSKKWTGSTHVRFGRRYEHPRVRASISVRFLSDVNEDTIRDLDSIVVLRNGAVGDDLKSVLKLVDKHSVRLILDLDDALTDRDHFPEGSPWRESADDIAQLAAAADHVTVSTERLRKFVSERHNESVEVLANSLDERLWFSPLDPLPREPHEPVRILYFGTTTHTADLHLLQRVVPAVSESLRRDVRLEVVGVSPSAGDDSWFDRLDVPNTCKPYPEFVKWLRMHRSRWDVGVAPLLAGGFNDYKSDLKFLELVALGLPVVASRVPAYESTIENGRNGLLVENDVDDWVGALASLLADPSRSAQLHERALAYVSSERLLHAVGPSIPSLLLGDQG